MNTQLARIEATEAVPFVPYSTEAVDKVIATVRAQCAVEKPDISTKKGRDQIISAAATVSRKKADFTREVESYIEGTKKEVKRIVSERTRAERALDDLRDEIRKPVTEWENLEKERVAVRDRRLADLRDVRFVVAGETQEGIQDRLNRLSELAAFDWQEFTARATETGEATLAVLQAKLAERVKYDDEQAELARLRQEKEDRDKKDREDKIAADAAAKVLADAKDAQDKKDAEAKAEQEQKDAAAKKIIDDALAEQKRLKDEADESERQKVQAQRDKEDADARAKKAADDAEAARIDAANKRLSSIKQVSVSSEGATTQEISWRITQLEELSKFDWREFQPDAEVLAIQCRAALDERMKERERADADKAEADRMDRERLAATQKASAPVSSGGSSIKGPIRKSALSAHERERIAKINNEALQAFVKGGITETSGKIAIELIAKGLVPNVKISY